MSVIDPVGDMITRIRNGYKSKLISVSVSYSDLKKGVLDVLEREGYVLSYKISSPSVFQVIDIFLKYSSRGEAAIVEIARVSKPGKRIYSPISNLRHCYSGMGTYVISTSRGIISDNQARSFGVGGELICKVF